MHSARAHTNGHVINFITSIPSCSFPGSPKYKPNITEQWPGNETIAVAIYIE